MHLLREHSSSLLIVLVSINHFPIKCDVLRNTIINCCTELMRNEENQNGMVSPLSSLEYKEILSLF